MIGVDSTHDNYFSLDPNCPRYAAFQELLEADGATVVDFPVPFDASCVPQAGSLECLTECPYLKALEKIDILVIVNPGAIGAEEAHVIADWLGARTFCDNRLGRGLILISDGGNGRPFPTALGNELGVAWHYEDQGDYARVFSSCNTAGGAMQ